MSKVLMDADVAELYADRVYFSSHGYPMVGDEYLHRIVMGSPVGKVVDHIDRNKSDCRRQNLRVATRAENLRNGKFRSNNTSGYRGVYLCKQTGRWSAQIRAEGRTRRLGRFDTALEAAQVYDEASRRLHGEFGVTNE